MVFHSSTYLLKQIRNDNEEEQKQLCRRGISFWGCSQGYVTLYHLQVKCQCEKSGLRVNYLLTVMLTPFTLLNLVLNAAPFTLLNLVCSTDPSFMRSRKGIHPDIKCTSFDEVLPHSFFLLSIEK